MKIFLVFLFICPSCYPIQSKTKKSNVYDSNANRNENSVSNQIINIIWIATQAGGDMVDVSITINGRNISLGQVNAETDTGPGSPSSCNVIDQKSPHVAEFSCGGTPAKNVFTATLKEGMIILSYTSGVWGEPGDIVKVIESIPVDGSSLSSSFQSP